MSNADRIEELRTKYEENPRRYFAPLANEYRKAGDLAQAIAICREHLPKQPGHMSGYIVYGQTLFEANTLDEARTVFEQALALDPENLIALKHLGDIARMNGENSVARRWYSRVLDADPRNDDIASQLASLGAPTPVQPAVAIPEPAPAPEPTGGEAVGVFASFDPNSLLDVPADVVGIAGGNQSWAPAQPEVRPTPQHEPLDLDFPDSHEPVAAEALDEEFEEGLIAPEWPDTTDLVARVVTPFHSATPISVPALPETVAAFGRESFDQVQQSPPDAPIADDLVDAFLPPDAIAGIEKVEAPSLNAESNDIELESFAGAAHDFGSVDLTSDIALDDAPPVDALDKEPSVSPSLIRLAGLDAVAAASDDEVSQNDIITGEVVMPANSRPAAPSFLEELASFDDTVEDEAVAAPVAAAVEEEVIAPLPDEEVVWADSIAASSERVIEASNELIVADDIATTETFTSESVAEDIVTTETFTSEFVADEFVADENFADESIAVEIVAQDSLHEEITQEFVAPAPVIAESHTVEFLEAEPAEGLSGEADDDLAFAAELPWQRESMDSVEAIASSDTAEFEVVAAHTAQSFADQAPAVTPEVAEESFADVAPVVAEHTFVDAAPPAIEETFANVASAPDSEAFAETTPDATEPENDEAAPVGAEESFAELTPVSAEESFAEVAAQVEAEKAAPFVTETMAELLVAQGFLPRAIEVYDELVRRRPHDPVLVARLKELRALHEADELSAVEAAAAEAAAASAVANLAATSSPTPITSHTPLYNTPIRNTPVYNTPLYNTPLYNTPLSNTPVSNAPLSSSAHATQRFNTPVSATPILVPSVGETETVSNVSERHSNERLQAFRTARERFAELSRRRVARRTPTHATAVVDDAADGLSSLFGTAVPATTDELAARALADAFGPVQDSGESLFDPAPAPTPALPMRSLTPRHNTAVYTPSALDSRSDKQGTDRQPAADYSFDRFFPDPAMAGREGQSLQGTIPAANATQPVNEDLAQFSAWLKGLNNT